MQVNLTLDMEKFEVKALDGYIWRKIFYHNSDSGIYFTTNNWDYQIDTNLYSLLGFIENLKPKTEKYYRFLLEYPEYEGYNMWEQSDAPKSIQDPDEAEYFHCIKCTWKERFGVLRNLSNSLIGSIGKAAHLTCDSNVDNWWYAFGVTSYTNNVLPGPIIKDGQFHSKVILWQQIEIYRVNTCIDEHNPLHCIQPFLFAIFINIKK